MTVRFRSLAQAEAHGIRVQGSSGWIDRSAPKPASAKSLQLASGARQPAPRRRGVDPQALLLDAVRARFAERADIATNHVPFDKGLGFPAYEIDIALVDDKVAIEVDGWEFHGKHKFDFQRDRHKDRLLVLHGWRVIRFTYLEITRQLDAILAQIEMVITLARGAAPEPDKIPHIPAPKRPKPRKTR